MGCELLGPPPRGVRRGDSVSQGKCRRDKRPVSARLGRSAAVGSVGVPQLHSRDLMLFALRLHQISWEH
jgi:hypothetical protein